MTPAAVLALVKWGGLALLIMVATALVVDRNHLAQLNNRHGQCLSAVGQKPGAKPLQSVCDPPIAQAAALAAQAVGCDAALAAHPDSGAPALCSPPIQRLAADRDAKAAEVANRDQQLDQARQTQAAAVARAETRAHSDAQRDAHAQSIVQAAPHDGSGDLVFDADRLRDLAGPDPADRRAGAGADHPG